MPHFDIGLSFEAHRELVRRAEEGDVAVARLRDECRRIEQMEMYGGDAQVVLRTRDGLQVPVTMGFEVGCFTHELRRPILSAYMPIQIDRPPSIEPIEERRYQRTGERIYGRAVFEEVFERKIAT
jgi:hypothetical protein